MQSTLIAVRLPKEMAGRVKEAAEQEETTASHIIRSAITQKLNRKPKARKNGKEA